MDCSPLGSSIHGILHPRILEWVAVPFSRDLPNPGIEPTSLTSPAMAGGFFITSTTWGACSLLCSSLPGVRPPEKIPVPHTPLSALPPPICEAGGLWVLFRAEQNPRGRDRGRAPATLWPHREQGQRGFSGLALPLLSLSPLCPRVFRARKRPDQGRLIP